MKRIAAFLLAACLLPGGAGAWPVPAAQGGPAAQVQAELDRAYALLQTERLEEAAAAFTRVLERDPQNRAARLALGYVSGRLGRWEESARHLGMASGQEPENLRLRMDYGYALEHAGLLADAEPEFEFVAARPGELQAQAQKSLEALRERRTTAENTRAARRDAFLNRGYAQLRAGNRAGARTEFEKALAEDPGNTTILKQLGYLAIEEGNLALAAQKFATAREAAPEDHGVALQLGYLYDRLDRPEQAAEAFGAAQGSPDPKTSQPARRALGYLRAERLRRIWLDVYAAPLYATRFSNGIAQFQAQLHWRPQPRLPVSLYAGTRITHDSRSRGGALPAVFSDNAALFGAGVAVQPRRHHWSFFAEANVAVNLTQTARRNRAVEPDYRAALLYYRRWDSRLYGPLGWLARLGGGGARGERLFTDVDASLGYYSRYDHNVIGYLQAREGLRLADIRASRLYGYAKVNLAKDTNRDFFNNVAEIGAGLEFRPHRDHNLSLRLEYLRGIYYGIEGRDRNPFGSGYNDLRITLLFAKRLLFR